MRTTTGNAHPEHDCDDCGTYHGAWSGHERDAEWRDELREELAYHAESLVGRLAVMAPAATLGVEHLPVALQRCAYTASTPAGAWLRVASARDALGSVIDRFGHIEAFPLLAVVPALTDLADRLDAEVPASEMGEAFLADCERHLAWRRNAR